MVCIAGGQHPTTEGELGSISGSLWQRGLPLTSPRGPFAGEFSDWSTIEIDLRQALDDAVDKSSQAVALVEIPTAQRLLYRSRT